MDPSQKEKLIRLGSTLRYIAGMIEDYEHVDEDIASDGEVQTGPDVALRTVREVLSAISKAENMASDLPRHPLIRESKVALTLV